MFGLEPLYGRVSINQQLPPLIKQKLAKEADFLASLHEAVAQEEASEDVDGAFFPKRYWSFPEYKEISTAVLHQHKYSFPGSSGNESRNYNSDLGRSLTPKRSRASQIGGESMHEYLNFPDPQLYMIGFQCVSPAQSKK